MFMKKLFIFYGSFYRSLTCKILSIKQYYLNMYVRINWMWYIVSSIILYRSYVRLIIIRLFDTVLLRTLINMRTVLTHHYFILFVLVNKIRTIIYKVFKVRHCIIPLAWPLNNRFIHKVKTGLIWNLFLFFFFFVIFFCDICWHLKYIYVCSNKNIRVEVANVFWFLDNDHTCVEKKIYTWLEKYLLYDICRFVDYRYFILYVYLYTPNQNKT